MTKRFREKIKFICSALLAIILLLDPIMSLTFNKEINSLSINIEDIEEIEEISEVKKTVSSEKYLKIEKLLNEYTLIMNKYKLLKEEIKSRPVYNEIPLMFQTYYPHIKYGGGSVSSSGCSISCLAMVVTYLTDILYTPGDLALKYRKAGKTNCECMENAATDLGLKWEKSYDWNKMKEALKNNQPVIVCVNSNTVFTEIEHLIVLTSIDEEGRIWVNDPYGPNYRENRHIKGFKEGFKEWEILTGLCGGWIFEAKTDNVSKYLAEVEELEKIQKEKYEKAIANIILS